MVCYLPRDGGKCFTSFSYPIKPVQNLDDTIDAICPFSRKSFCIPAYFDLPDVLEIAFQSILLFYCYRSIFTLWKFWYRQDIPRRRGEIQQSATSVQGTPPRGITIELRVRVHAVRLAE